MSPSPVEELALTDLDRSNKGASKQRRDLINSEIAVMRDLLPLSESARQRLSQLQVMSLSCVFIRKCNVLRTLFSSIPAEANMPTMCDFSQALTGFLLITTREGKLVYISENVTDYLGHSMVDMKTQGDSLYDIVDKRDEASVRAHLLQGGKAQPDLEAEVAFFCRMNMSRTLKRQSAFGDIKVMHVKGHFLPLSDPSAASQQSPAQPQQPQKYVFMATCSPLITPELKESLIQSNTMVFKTVHHMDMSFLEVTKTAEYHLGCSMEDICKTSWYSMLHPEDVHEAREKHVLLMRASHDVGCMMTVRMLTMKGEMLWVNVVMQVRQATSTSTSSSNAHSDDKKLIVCLNQVISESEAFQIRMQSHMFCLYPPRTADLWSSPTTAATLGQPQPLPTTDPLRWMPSSSSMPIPGMPPPMPQTLPAMAYMGGQQTHGGYHPSSPPSSSSSAVLSPSGHTDKLKLMLKHKLQGTSCHYSAAKVPKMEKGGRSPSSGVVRRSDCRLSTSPLQSSRMKSGGGGDPGTYSWSVASQATPAHLQYQAALSAPAMVGAHQQAVVASSVLASPPSQGSLSPPLVSPPLVCQEQVVPQSQPQVRVPESFLTPDSSPASSPDPQPCKSSNKVTPPASVAVVTQFDQLPVLVQTKSAATLGGGPCIKVESSMEGCRHHAAERRRELPVMDASDIESFFHILDSGKQFAAMDAQKTRQFQSTLQAMSACLESQPSFNKAASTTRAEIKQETAGMAPDQGSSCLAAQQEATPGPTKKPTEDTQQSEADFQELEELLSFFSGEMTATQLSLDDLMESSPAAKGEAAEAVESSQVPPCRQQEVEVCGAGHLDHFLLPIGGMERPREGFSPVSPADLSSEEEGSGEETTHQSAVWLKGEKHGRVPPPPLSLHGLSPSPSPPSCPQAPQDVPGIHEEDELYQLNKLLSFMGSDSGVMLLPDSQ